MAEKKKKKHKYHKLHAEHHRDGSISSHFESENGPEHDHKSAHASLNHLHDAVEDQMGEPNAGEAAASAGDHGVPEAQAGPAGLPTPVPAAAAAPAGMPGQGA